MKSATTNLVSYLNGFRPTSDANLCVADLYTILLSSGTALAYTNGDIPVAWNGKIFLANSVQISGLLYKSTADLSVDKPTITINARSTDTINGAPFLQAIVQGLFDGALVQRQRAFFTNWTTNSSGYLVPIGTVSMFRGHVTSIDSVGRTQAKVTVASDTVLLDIDMPRRLWSPSCTHVLYDTGCGLPRGTYSANGTVGSGSTVSVIQWSGASTNYEQGSIVFTSGSNVGASRNIASANSSSLQMSYPLLVAPSTGDAFTALQGCDHTLATCTSKFNNSRRYRGYPFVPPPEIMTGPLSVTYTVGGGK
jgi:uncharacterized phage protein (TIGR02218 family)